MPTTAMSPVKLEPPNRLTLAGRSTVVGATVYVAISALAEAGGRMPRAEFCRRVWGRESVTDAAVWSLCHRVSEKLKCVGCPERCGLDCGEVAIC